jgi:hypothetical protein
VEWLNTFNSSGTTAICKANCSIDPINSLFFCFKLTTGRVNRKGVVNKLTEGQIRPPGRNIAISNVFGISFLIQISG